MQRKRFVIVMLLCFLAAFLVTAGGQKEAPEAAAVKEKVEITWWSTQELHGTILQEYTARFSELNPHIKVKYLLPTPGGSPNEYTAKYVATFVAGNPPDLIDMGQTKPSDILNHLTPLDKLGDLEKDLQISEIPEGIFPFGNIDGHTYSIPLFSRSLGLYYNKDMYKEAGLDPEKPPVTLDELAAYATRLAKDENKDGTPEQWGHFVSHGPILPTGLYWYTYLWREGGTILNKDQTKATYNSPAGIRALQWYVDLIYKHKAMPLMPEIKSFGQIFDTFFRKQSAHVEHWSETVSRLKDVDWKWGAAPQPLTKGGPEVSFVGGNCFTIPVKAKHPKEAYEFLKWFLSPNIHIDWVTKADFLPIRASDTQNPAYQSWLQGNEIMRPFTVYLAGGRNRPTVPPMAKIQDATARAIEKAVFRKATPEEALNEAVAKSNDFLAGK